jgi:hypothetical protein
MCVEKIRSSSRPICESSRRESDLDRDRRRLIENQHIQLMQQHLGHTDVAETFRQLPNRLADHVKLQRSQPFHSLFNLLARHSPHFKNCNRLRGVISGYSGPFSGDNPNASRFSRSFDMSSRRSAAPIDGARISEQLHRRALPAYIRAEKAATSPRLIVNVTSRQAVKSP